MIHELFEVSDMRATRNRLPPVAVLENIPGAINVWSNTGRNQVFLLTDDNTEWKDGTLTLYTEQGMISFVPLHPSSDVLAFVDTPIDGLLQDCLR